MAASAQHLPQDVVLPGCGLKNWLKRKRNRRHELWNITGRPQKFINSC